jgi:hypothetical protein
MKVFVSCGQHTPEECRIEHEVCGILRRRGFQPYLAIAVQTTFRLTQPSLSR